MKNVAVIGGGISGLAAALELAKAGMEVVLYEKEEYLGGAASRIVTVHDGIDLDLNIMLFNPATYPGMMEFFERNDIDTEECEMSFSVSLNKGRKYEWGTRNGFSSLFSQKKNAFSPYFWRMLREISNLKGDVLKYLEELEENPNIARTETLGHFVNTRGYSHLFQEAYLVPICASFWSCSSEGALSFSAYSVLSFLRNHHLLEPFGCSQGLTVRCRAHNFAAKIREQLESRGCQIRSRCEVHSVTTTNDGCVVASGDGSQETYHECIMAIATPDALKLLGKQATYDEMRIFGAFQYVCSDIFLHRDKNLMPQNPAAWSTWNFLGTVDRKLCVTYWLNVLQNIGETESPYLVTLNLSHTPDYTLHKRSTRLRLPTVAASKASIELDHIQGKRGIWFCGAYHGYGFYENKLKAGIVIAHGALRTSILLSNPKHMTPSLIETWARFLVTSFLKHYISTGCLILLEEGGKVFTFRGTSKKCPLKASLRIHNPRFYWKVATQADLGLADAYIHGDFSMVDGNEGLLKLFMIFISNRVSESSSSKFNNKRGWWTPLLYTAGVSSAKFFFKHLTRQNTITQARRNISCHYDLSNELFALFMDETMQYSCPVFKSEGEELKDAQLRKISLLIKKARIEKEHEVLELGCGWGSFAIEVVKKTGCKYTGITLSKEQLRFAQAKAKESGLQISAFTIVDIEEMIRKERGKRDLYPQLEDRIRFLLLDYRQLPNTYKYDRIICCELIEHVGHEYMEEFFGCCESLLEEDGILVLQFTSYPDAEYDECRRSAGFIKEYIFPGGCLPSLSRVTSAMASTSGLCIENLEQIGKHYYRALRYWRKNILDKQSEILAMGFDEKFVRTWEYYFDYCAAGFKSRLLGNYQIVFSRPCNLSVFDNPYEGFPSPY